MTTYSLQFVTDGLGEGKHVEFEAHNSARALDIMQAEAPGRAAELWKDGVKLCTVRHDFIGSHDLWLVSD